MWNWLRKRPAPLTGAPAVRRQKTYSAQSGYVYQYYYEGQREVSRGRERGAEYVFEVTADRKTSFPVSVFVSSEALAVWEQRHGRSLTATERYAIAKMALFAAFDEREDPRQMRDEVRVQPADVEAILERLGIE
ncbi:MAG: hypothetical protein RMK57_09455 [Bryobacterales bacterium]|nr:hypothetical protein [Bryobacteraceae bacterium]MDW8354743.1 hypothetical protein [Bryobacterales bacterium]